MKRVMEIGALAILACCSSPALAQAACEPEFVQSAQTLNVPDIDVSSGGITTETFQISVRNAGTGAAACQAVLRFARLSTSPSAGTIDYSFQSGGQVLEILASDTLPGTASSDLNLASLSTASSGQGVPLQVNVPSGWGISSGSQVDDLLVSLVDTTGTTVDTLILRVALNVPPAAEVRIVGATGQSAIAQIDLGTLDPDATTISDPFGVRVWSTSAYTVSFQSENDGTLVHSGDRSRTIEYQLYMNNGRVDVRGAPAAYIPRKTDALGDMHPMSIRVEPFQALAGDYSDRIEVTVTAE